MYKFNKKKKKLKGHILVETIYLPNYNNKEIRYNLYHPDTGRKFDTSNCKDFQDSVFKPLFENNIYMFLTFIPI